MPAPRGDTDVNVTVGPHVHAGTFLGYSLVFHQAFLEVNDWSEPITAMDRGALSAAAAISQEAFDQAAAALWGSWYTSRVPIAKTSARLAAQNY